MIKFNIAGQTTDDLLQMKKDLFSEIENMPYPTPSEKIVVDIIVPCVGALIDEIVSLRAQLGGYDE